MIADETLMCWRYTVLGSQPWGQTVSFSDFVWRSVSFIFVVWIKIAGSCTSTFLFIASARAGGLIRTFLRSRKNEPRGCTTIPSDTATRAHRWIWIGLSSTYPSRCRRNLETWHPRQKWEEVNGDEAIDKRGIARRHLSWPRGRRVRSMGNVPLVFSHVKTTEAKSGSRAQSSQTWKVHTLEHGDDTKEVERTMKKSKVGSSLGNPPD